MNNRQKEVIGQSLADEKTVLKALTDNYTTALADIKKNIRELQANPLTQSKAYQLEYQKQLETMVSGILDTLQGNNFNSIADYLQNSYTNSYIGNLYDMHGQGVPLILPMNENQVVKAVQKTGDDFKLSEKLGGNTKELKKQVKSELQRGLATALSYETIARSISDYGQADLNRSMRIARTEGHRIQTEAKLDCMNNAKKKGANIVKQWDSTLDGRTRPEHKQLDGQIREIDENFEVDGYSAQGPGGFGDPYMDCNCRCCLLQRAKWALDDEELKTLQDRAEYFGLDKSQNFQDFKDKYINVVEIIGNHGIMELARKPLKINIQLFAKIPKEKFTKYALDQERQPNKARAFREALGYTVENYQDLIDNVRNNFDEKQMVFKSEDNYGKRYELVMKLTGANGKKANVCTGWIKEKEDSEPRLTSVYVTKKKVTNNDN
ncbi:MAG: phage head morphogenesis protein [Ruminococcus sp.]|nr:DUF6883 domain-containing protein [Ruminococcus sp.]MCI5617914.1 phage head morphogenesis protein [Ruminococcus sp.]